MVMLLFGAFTSLLRCCIVSRVRERVFAASFWISIVIYTSSDSQFP